MKTEDKASKVNDRIDLEGFELTDDVKMMLNKNKKAEWIIGALFIANVILIILGVGAIFYSFYRRLET